MYQYLLNWSETKLVKFNHLKTLGDEYKYVQLFFPFILNMFPNKRKFQDQENKYKKFINRLQTIEVTKKLCF